MITVCDEASAEKCPVFPGNVSCLHWGFEDPSLFEGSEGDKHNKVKVLCSAIETKIVQWLSELEIQL